MATLSVKLLEELVTCNICLNQYDEGIRKPKFLQCSHTICLECFQAIRNRYTIACPFCRTSTSNGHIYEIEWILPTNQYALDILRLMRTALKVEEDNQFIAALAMRYCREMEEALDEESVLDQEQEQEQVTAKTDSCDTSNSETFDQELKYWNL
ncbi:hypothetical protein DAPPUDRAFT_316826 [Daphnia pulex]|uniref:RING-type domain-containing protein n=1 Tax=Daphnia pulex TaxID=6669 RepID=E9GE40_DAPPU|nr:hypothetical protein DAPPUDRAFT_316826 [Daphnia pulex]|eukprot:EFX82382.1 hypothetical protein DAPPUDRAFT_316826 [Daphnia pulex]